ncbi:nucleolar protein dao-5-like isoform X2 [Sitophilus oryzae]|uniref:Nucleolar protein dao-5-like isoform X2 n=1 Tax=Sitophilus oryzae TaxID=7048 RepID=A0A6J2YQL0_SITOR|nr:nucleolar protein dao-5-like isoform X2 [Sitophilus oryzae]
MSSENHPHQREAARATRIARYKEERRRQLAEQFGRGVGEAGGPAAATGFRAGSSSSGSEGGPRPTRASSLRAQVVLRVAGSPKTEKSVSPLSDGTPKNKQERDKSSKRKSNLNRSLTCEEVPPSSFNDQKTTRRRRRFFPQEVLDQSPRPPASTTSGDTPTTASPLTPSPNLPSPARFTALSSPTAAFSSATVTPTSPLTTPRLTTPRRSDLSVHMENARRAVTSPSTPDTHKYKPFAARKAQMASVSKDKSSPVSSLARTSSAKQSASHSDNETNKNIAKRMEELRAFTRETLARVERLANRTKEIPANATKRQSPARQVMDTTPSSILKRKPREEKETVIVVVNETPGPSHVCPVSILKRKVAQDEKTEPHSTPVTFSPSVVEPATTNRKQGILKKRRSLDESTVMRHRSCSPDVANKFSDSKSILKNQRRSSLEELRRTQSPEIHIQGILKRKPRPDDDDHSLNSPQSILKRRSGASSAGSNSSTPHVSITTAVILAAAGGAEMVLEPEASQESVKPILKKKSFSEDYSYSFSGDSSSDGPKPILKKKSSTDTDDGEDKPMRPILKLPRNSLEREILDTGQEGRYSRFSSQDSDDVKPILKSGSLRAESPRPRLSFCGDAATAPSTSSDVEASRFRTSRRSYTVCADFNVTSNAIGRSREDDRDLKKARPLSVLELIKTFEKNVGTGEGKSDGNGGAIPKKRSGDRYRTQPVTSNELEASRNLVNHTSPRHASQSEDHSPRPSQFSYHAHSTLSGSSRSLDAATFDFTSPLENESRLNSFLSSSFQTVGVSPESPVCHKTSSDSAFQSLGDGLELEEPPEETEESDMSLASQMRSLAEEAKKKRQERDQNISERRGILKQPHPSDASSPLPRRSQSFASARPALRRRDSPPAETTRLDSFPLESSRAESAFRKVKPSRTETATDKDDEGISCNDSGSDSETSEVKGRVQRNKGGALDDTSEGESSGGREVKSIFRHENSRLGLNFK